MPTLAELMAETQAPVSNETAPRGTSLSDLAQEATGPDTYHRDRLKAFLADPQAQRYGYDASMLDDLRRNAQAEQDAEDQVKDVAGGHQTEQQYRAANPVRDVSSSTSIGADQRGIWQQAVDVAHAGALGARTGLYQGLSAIDTAGNLLHVIPDETAQRMHDLKRESERVSDLGGTQGAVAGGAQVAAGLPNQLNPITAPLVAGGQTGEDILATTGNDLLAAGDRTKATLAAIGAGAPAALASKMGGFVAGPGEGIWNQAAHAMTAAGAYSVPGAIATGAVAGDDPRLQELAQREIQGIPESSAIMTGASLLGPVAAGLRGARPPMTLEEHAAAQPEYQRLDALWEPHDGRPEHTIFPAGGELTPADIAMLRAQSPDALGTIKNPEPDNAPIAVDPLAAFSPEEMRAMAIRNGEGGDTLDVAQGTAANQAQEFIRSVPRDLFDVPVNRRGDTLADGLRQIDVHADPAGALGNAQMLVQAAQRNAPDWRQGEQARNRQQVLAEEEQGGGAQGGTDLASLAQEVVPPSRGRTYERELEDQHIQQPGRETDPNLRSLREQEMGRTSRDLAAVEDQQATQQAREATHQDQLKREALDYVNRTRAPDDQMSPELMGLPKDGGPLTIGRPKPAAAAAPERMTPAERAQRAAQERAEHLRAEEEAANGAPVEEQPPRAAAPGSEPVRDERFANQLERVRDEESQTEGGSHAPADHQQVREGVRRQEGEAGVLRDREQAGARPRDVQEGRQAGEQARSQGDRRPQAPVGDVVSRPGANGKPVVVDRTRSVPLAAGISKVGKRVYIDPDMPRTVTTKDGKVVDVDKYLVIHETAEKPGMDEQGKPYPKAHDENAVPAENAALRADGIDPDEFNALLKPSIDAIAARSKAEAAKNAPQNLPPDLHEKHLEASRKAGLISETKMVPNSKPELAIRSENPAEREALKLHDATREVPEGVSVDQNIKSAHEALEKDFQGEAAKLEQHLVNGGAANATQIEMARLIRDRLFREKQRFPSLQNQQAWTKWAELDRLAGSTWGSAGRQMRDRMQSPAERFAEANSVARITPTKLARKIQERAQQLAKDKAAAAVAAAQAKAHRAAVESLAKSAAPKPKPETGTAAERLKIRQKELADEFERLAKKAKSFLDFSSNKPTGSNRFLELGYELLANRIKAGFTKFARAALNIAGRIREYRFNDEAKRALEDAYDQHAAENGDVEERTQSIDEVLLADRIKREQKVLESREKNIAAKFEATKGMSDEQLRDYLNREDQQGRLHPAIVKLREDFKRRTEAMTKAMKERADRVQAPERDAEQARRAAQREQARIAAEPQRILDAERALVEKHAKLQNMTDDQVRAWYESNKAKIPPEIQRLREASKERTAAVRAEIAKRRREVFRAEREAKVLAKRVAAREKEVADLKAKDQKRYERIKRRLKQYGFDMDDPNAEWTKTKAGFDQFLLAQRAAGAGIGAMLNEHYVAALHMSTKIPLKKLGSDVVNLAMDMAQRPLRAGFHSVGNLATGKSPMTPWVGMFKAYGALWPGFKEGLVNAGRSFHAERSIFPNAEMNELNVYPAVPGIYGKGLRLFSGLTGVRMADSFAKALFARMELADHAHRTALDENGRRLTGDALTKHLQSETTNPDSRSWKAAIDHANRMTFTETPIWPVHQLNSFKYSEQKTLTGKAGQVAANLLTPFTVIPTNIGTQAATRFVPGLADFLTLVKGLHKDGETGEYGFKGTGARDFADAVTRWAAVGLVASLNENGDITGRLDEKFPYSIHVGDHHFSYEQLGSIGKGLSVLVDAVEGARHGHPFRALKDSLADAASEEALVRPMVDLVKAKEAEERYGDGWAQYLARQTPVPTAIGQVRSASDDTVEDHYAGTKGMPFGEAYLHFLKDKVGLPWTPPPRLEHGKPMPKDSFQDWPIGTWLWRAFMPTPMEDERRPKKPAKAHQ